ncbi:MAG: peroxiredoxin [Candidatus Woesearchaeota archaeon]
MTLTTGDKAPDFCLTDKDGQEICLKNIKSKYTLVYFYPKDNTPGCTTEARGFQHLKEEFDNKDVTIIGISGGDEKSKRSFCEKNGLDIILLSDKDYSVSSTYEVCDEKKMAGRTSKAITRISFLLDKDKNIIKTYPNVKPETHPHDALDDIKELEKLAI